MPPQRKNNPNAPFVQKPQRRQDTMDDAEERAAASDILAEQRGGHYRDRIKREPFSQMMPKPGPFIPKDVMKRT